MELADGEAGDAEGLRAEVEACPDCRAESRALAAALRDYERASADDDPPAQFWPAYHARLAETLRANISAQAGSAAPPAAHAQTTTHAARAASPATHLSSATARPSPSTRRPSSSVSRLSLLAARVRDALTATWRVPAPAAVAAGLLLVASLSALALRRAPAAVDPPAQPLAPSLAQSPAPARIVTVEVPVVRERVVTRTVYVERARRASRRDDFDLARDDNDTSATRVAARVEPRADTLAGFKPAGDVKLRVLKGSFEK